MKAIDISGQKFGRLTALYRLHNIKGRTKWICVCECGNFIEVTTDNLRRGTTISCGCYRHNALGERSITHGKSNSRLYYIYCHMKSRCYNHNNPRYKDYGGRGITICDEWINDFMAFYNWAYEHGYKSNLTIDRIDNNKGYTPDNCQWATKEQQNRNRRNVKLYTLRGETHCLREWCSILNINYKTIHRRIHVHKWDVERALFTPIRKCS